MSLKKYDELRKIDVSQWTDKRDGAEYLNWAKLVDLLHENGAEIVYFEPVVNPTTGSSLFMADKEYVDSKGNTNRVYETAVKIVIDDLEFIKRGPVTNGSNPVKDNSMSQQRLWNCQTRLFVKGVAIRTGLGFDLWLKEEHKIEKDSWEDDITEKVKTAGGTFSWIRSSNSDDSIWNNSHLEQTSNTIIITNEDIVKNAQFSCEVQFDDEKITN